MIKIKRKTNKGLIAKLIIAVLLLMLSVSYSMAETTQDHSQFGSLNFLVVSWTTASESTSITDFITRNINGLVLGVETLPSDASAPTASYDITLTNQYGLDIMGGALANRSATATEYIQPYNATEGGYVSMPVDGALTVAILGNSVTDASGEIIVYYFAR